METESLQTIPHVRENTVGFPTKGDEVSFYDPATMLFEITFGIRVEKQRESNLEAPVSKTGFNIILNMWM